MLLILILYIFIIILILLKLSIKDPGPKGYLLNPATVTRVEVMSK